MKTKLKLHSTGRVIQRLRITTIPPKPNEFKWAYEEADFGGTIEILLDQRKLARYIYRAFAASSGISNLGPFSFKVVDKVEIPGTRKLANYQISMRITKLTASGIKGGNFTHELGPVTVFSGPYASGKTARLAALELGLLGHSPKLGKRPGDTFQLASGSKLRVRLESDGGAATERVWEKQGESVKQSGPKDPLVPAILLDYRELFAMSGPERLAFLSGKVDVERLGFKPEKVLESVLFEVDKNQSDTPCPEPRAELVKISGDLDRARQDEGASVQDWLAQFLDEVKAKEKSANDQVRQLTGSARTAVQLSGVAGNVPRGTLDPEIAAAEAELQRCRKVWGDWDSLKKQAEAKSLEWDRLKPRGFTSPPTAVAAREKTANEIRAKIKSLEKAAWGWKATDIGHRLGGIQAELQGTQHRIEQKDKDILDCIEQHEGYMQLDRCPFCKHDGKGWTKAIIKDHTARLKIMKDARAEMDKTLSAFRSQLVAVKKEYDADQEKAKAYSAAHAELKTLRPILEQTERDITAAADTETRRAVLRDEIMKIDAQLNSGAEDASAASAMIAHTQAKIASLRSERDRWIKMKGEEQQLARAQTQLRTETERAALFKIAAKTLQGIQGELIQRSMESLLEPANKLTAGFLPGPFEYFEGNFGYRTPEGQWVGHATMCGTEQAIGYAGLSVALAQEAQCKILLMDGLDVDHRGKTWLFQRLVQLQKSGVIDQAVCTDVGQASMNMEGVTVIALERKEE